MEDFSLTLLALPTELEERILDLDEEHGTVYAELRRRVEVLVSALGWESDAWDAEKVAQDVLNEVGQYTMVTREQFARMCGIAPDTLSAYVTRGQAPTPDEMVGRMPTWKLDTAREFADRRKQQGSRKDLRIEQLRREALSATQILADAIPSSAVVLSLDGDGDPLVWVADLEDPEDTAYPYVVLIDHADDLSDIDAILSEINWDREAERVRQQWRGFITSEQLVDELVDAGNVPEDVENAIIRNSGNPGCARIGGVTYWTPGGAEFVRHDFQ